jgi:hypothetical protein
VATLQEQIETAMTRVGDLGVSIAGMSNDLEDTKEALTEERVRWGRCKGREHAQSLERVALATVSARSGSRK